MIKPTIDPRLVNPGGVGLQTQVSIIFAYSKMVRVKANPIRWSGAKRVASPIDRGSVKRPRICWGKLLHRWVYHGGYYAVDENGDIQWMEGDLMVPSTPERWPVRKLVFDD